MAGASEREVSGKGSVYILKGTCMEMCPERERILREQQRRLHPFEIVQDRHGQEKPKADIKATVKEFSRPAAGRHLQTNELRPTSVLVKTTDYLLRHVLTKPSPWHIKCDFVSDRIRAIRQDLTAQDIIGQDAIGILEKTTRYYMVTGVKLCQEPVENYDPVLHNTHIQECLKKLLYLYEFSHSGNKIYANRPTFEACYLLLNLGSPEAFFHLWQLSERLRKCKVIQLAIRLTKAFLNGNFVGIFRILTKLPFLESCALFCHIEPIRCQALAVMTTAYSSRNLTYPLSMLTKILHFHTEDIAAEFCTAHGISVVAGEVFFAKGQFAKPERCKPLPCHGLIESKLKDNITDVLLFHKQSGWDNQEDDFTKKPLKSQEQKIDIQELSNLTVEIKATTITEVQQKGLVSSEKRPVTSRGCGRAKRKMYLNLT